MDKQRLWDLRVTHGEDEGLARAGPHAVELTSIPNNLEEEDGHPDGVSRRAGSDMEEETVSANGSSGVSHVRLRDISLCPRREA
jgi:hypothetical protein